MSAAAESGYRGALSGPWLAARLAVDPARIDAMRRGGDLIAVRAPGAAEWHYPAWQFRDGRPLRDIARITAEARGAGMDESSLYDLLTAPMGLGGGGRRSLVDLLLEGRTDEVVAAIRAAR
jgi:hypothetical protein